MWAARLYFAFPEMCDRSCANCERWQYADTPGEMGPLIRLDDGRPMPRPEGIPTPCHQCPKVPDSAPAKTREHAIEPTERSWTALAHYRRCKVVGRFPEDEIVERNAALLAQVERDADFARQRDAAGLIAVLFASAAR